MANDGPSTCGTKTSSRSFLVDRGVRLFFGRSIHFAHTSVRLISRFRQVGSTITGMYQHYPRSLGVFYLAVVFAESAANSFTVVSVIYLVDYIDMSSTEVILFFLVALIGFLPGTQLAAVVTHRTDPKNSWRLGLSVMFVVTVAGALGLQPGMKAITFVWGFLIGITLGKVLLIIIGTSPSLTNFPF